MIECILRRMWQAA
jgi:Uncharacterized protein conserved in bacteria